MKKLLTILCAVLSGVMATAKPEGTRETPASDGRVTFIGRTLADGNDVTFDWTGVCVRVKFEGSYLAIRVTDTDKDYYNLWIDREPDEEADRIVAVQGRDTVIVLYDEADFKARYGTKVPKMHTAALMKRTEGEQGKTTLHAFLTKGPLLPAAPVKERVIEFVGDSYTCGYGSENSVASDPFTKESENQNKAYAAILGRYFDADLLVVAHSGMGVVRNYSDKLRDYCMPDRYLNVFDDGFDKREDTPPWSPACFAASPDITVIYLGANDFSTGRQPAYGLFRDGYIRLLREIKDFYGKDHPVLCAASSPAIFEYVKAAAEASGLSHVHCLGMNPGVFAGTELGASSHPNYAAHRKLAYEFIPYIATMTGWGLQDRPVK